MQAITRTLWLKGMCIMSNGTLSPMPCGLRSLTFLKKLASVNSTVNKYQNVCGYFLAWGIREWSILRVFSKVEVTSIAPPQELCCIIQEQYSELGRPRKASVYVSKSFPTSIAMICLISVCAVVSTLPLSVNPEIIIQYLIVNNIIVPL